MEGFAIFVAVIIIVSVTAINNYLRDKQFRNLNSKREQRVVPVRLYIDTCILNILLLGPP
jgi:hypothetical protein